MKLVQYCIVHQRNWIGPLRIQAILDDTHYLVSDWTGQLLPKRIHNTLCDEFR